MTRSGLVLFLVASMTLIVGATTISDVQTDPSLLGQVVTVEGVVTVGTNTFSSVPERIAVIQDGTGPWSGVMLFRYDGLPTLSLGDRVQATGTVAEYYDRTELDIADPSDITILGSEAVPPVTWIAANDISNSNPGVAEGYEGVLVGIENIIVQSIDSYEYTASDGAGECLIGWWSVAWEDCPVNVNDTYASVVGLADYSYSNYKLQPRDAGDYNYPVPVEFGTLSAESRGNAVVVRWSTITETDNFGFNVLRSGSEAGPFAVVNDQLIRGSGNTVVPQSYIFSDRAVSVGNIYYYIVQDISSDGNTSDHGPVSCTFTPQNATSWGSLKAEFIDR